MKTAAAAAFVLTGLLYGWDVTIAGAAVLIAIAALIFWSKQ